MVSTEAATPGKERSARATVRLSELDNLLLGAAGGTLETMAQMPLITWKLCLQEGRAVPKSLSGWFRGGATKKHTQNSTETIDTIFKMTRD